jgi:5-methylthioadenosine/S-adenosylhomocysteine deaminase
VADVGLIVAGRKVLLQDADGTFVVEPASIEIRGLRIHAVHRGTRAPGTHLPVTDFGERLIIPAFVDAHTHLALNFLRGADAGQAASGRMVEDLFYRLESKLRAEDVKAFARMGAYESLLSGVGLVYDHYYYAEAVAEAFEEVGLAGVIAPTLQDISGPGVAMLEAQIEATRRIAESSRFAARGLYAAVGPHAGDTVSAGLWSRAAELARALDVPLHAHIAQSPQEWSAVVEREGLPPLAFVQKLGVLNEAPVSLLAHGLYATRDELDAVPAERVRFAFCPHSQLVFGFPAPVLNWLEMGLDFVVATDCGASNDSLNLQKELRFLAGASTMGVAHSLEYERYFEGGAFADPSPVATRRRTSVDRASGALSAPAILHRAFGLAGALHPRFVAGRIEPEALASLVVLDLDHPNLWPARDLPHALVYGDVAPAIHAMLVAGRWVGSPGRFHQSLTGSEEYRAAREEATARLGELLER